MIAIAALAALVFAPMLLELQLSRGNERRLRANGAIEPSDDVYVLMAWAYPVSFAAMLGEGAIRGLPPPPVIAAGALVFGAAKAIKYWAIWTLGRRWTFRVLVTPGAPLVASGPYAHFHHPNYIGVMGELVGVALLGGAPLSGTLAIAGFAWLLRRRIAIENRALGRDQHTSGGV
jgi:methyltransferase